MGLVKPTDGLKHLSLHGLGGSSLALTNPTSITAAMTGFALPGELVLQPPHLFSPSLLPQVTVPWFRVARAKLTSGTSTWAVGLWIQQSLSLQSQRWLGALQMQRALLHPG